MPLLYLLALAVQPQTAPPATPAPAVDIVVIGQRMRRIRVVTRRDRKTGEQRCVVRRSGGDPQLDTAICDATIACASTETKQAGMLACMQQRMPAIAQRFSRPTRPD